MYEIDNLKASVPEANFYKPVFQKEKKELLSLPAKRYEVFRSDLFI